MRKILLLSLLPILSFSQNNDAAKKIIYEGIKLHDEGKYSEAIEKYNEALKLDKDNHFALTEKAMSLEATKKYEESIEICQYLLSKYPKEDNKTVYITYGNSLDHSNKPDEAIKIYDLGIKTYPDYYQLYFNKAITLINKKETEKSLENFQKSAILNPNHAGTMNALALLNNNQRIISILSSLRYLVIDNRSSRAKTHLESVLELMNKGVSQNDEKNITVLIDSQETKKKKKKENDFSAVDMILSISTTLDFDEKNKDKTQSEKTIYKLESTFSVLKELQKKQKGFYWEFFAPYFISLKENNLIEPFTYIIFLPSQSEDVKDYHQKNAKEIDRFYEWNKNYSWKSK